MSKTVAINPPKTPCTTETRGVAKATIPNICKMPGPPAPFVPAPLPNIGKSSLSPKGYSTTVKIEGHKVAIRGATFESMGDMASKGTGGGLISANTHGPTKFITPGSMNVKIEGKNVHLLGEPMLNNCGPSGSPPNTGATMMGFDTYDATVTPEEQAIRDIMCNCHQNPPPPQPPGECRDIGNAKHECCEQAIAAHQPPPNIGGERGYLADGTPAAPRASYRPAPPRGSGFPDACALDAAGNPTQFFDFKFICPDGTRFWDRSANKGMGGYRSASGRGSADANFFLPRGRSQFEKYCNIGRKLNPPTQRTPKPLSSRECR